MKVRPSLTCLTTTGSSFLGWSARPSSQPPGSLKTTTSPRSGFGAEPRGELVDQDPVADPDGLLHGAGRDHERLHQEGLQDQRDQHGDADQQRYLPDGRAPALALDLALRACAARRAVRPAVARRGGAPRAGGQQVVGGRGRRAARAACRGYPWAPSARGHAREGVGTVQPGPVARRARRSSRRGRSRRRRGPCRRPASPGGRGSRWSRRGGRPGRTACRRARRCRRATADGLSPGCRNVDSSTGRPFTSILPSLSQQTTSVSPDAHDALDVVARSRRSPVPSNTTTSPRRGSAPKRYANLFTRTRSPILKPFSMDPLGIWNGCTTKALTSSRDGQADQQRSG